MRSKVIKIGCGFLAAAIIVVVSAWTWWYINNYEERKVLAYVVRVEVEVAKTHGKSMGSGVLISGKCTSQMKDVPCSRIITAAHVVGSGGKLHVYWGPQEVVMEARLIDIDTKIDVAILSVDEQLPKAPLWFGELEIGEKVWAAGYPFGRGHGISLDSGYLLDTDELDLRQTSASTWPGNSGGAVFAWRWRQGYVLVGMTASGLAYGRGFANTVGFFVPMKSIEEFLIRNHVIPRNTG